MRGAPRWPSARSAPGSTLSRRRRRGCAVNQRPTSCWQRRPRSVSGEYDSALSGRRIQTYCWHGGRPVNYEPTDMVRTQDLQPVFVETSGFYLYSREDISRRHRRIGDRPLFVEVSEWEAIDIDWPQDYEMARRFEDLLGQRA